MPSAAPAKSTKYIDIGRDFATALGPRYRRLGINSGEEFYERLLKPAYLSGDEVVVALDSLEGWTSSFFEEAFGGLVREFGLKEVMSRVSFLAVRRAHLVPMIESWMREAGDDR